MLDARRSRRRAGQSLCQGFCREWKINSIIDPSERTYRVPNTHEVYLAFARKGLFKVGRDSEIDWPLFHHSDFVRNQGIVTDCKESGCMKQSAKRSGGISSATEAKHVNAVFGFDLRVRWNVWSAA